MFAPLANTVNVTMRSPARGSERGRGGEKERERERERGEREREERERGRRERKMARKRGTNMCEYL